MTPENLPTGGPSDRLTSTDALVGLRIDRPPDDMLLCGRCRCRRPVDHPPTCPICGHPMRVVSRRRHRVVAVLHRDVGKEPPTLEVVEVGFVGDRHEFVDANPVGRDRTAERRVARRVGMAQRLVRQGMTPTGAAMRVDDIYDAAGYWHKTCAECGRPFMSRRSDARCCERPGCRKARSRRRSQISRGGD